MPDATRSFALTFVDELARNGVTHAVVAPGSRSTPIALALVEHPSITVHVRIDERSASFLALGIAKASGRPVPVLCTSGTAAANFHPAVLEADQSDVPLMVLTADRPPELRGIGANQTIDQVDLYGGAVRWSVDVPVPEPDSEQDWRQLASEAITVATDPVRRGPVHLNLPLREPLVPSEPSPPAEAVVLDASATTPSNTNAPKPRSASRGVVVIGDTGGRDVQPMLDLAVKIGWPVIAEPHSGGRTSDANVIRASDALLSDNDFRREHQPELVVVVGRVGLSRALIEWLSNQRHIVISPSGRHLDVANSAEQVLSFDLDRASSLIADEAPAEWLATWLEADAAASTGLDAILDGSDELTEPRIARDVVALMPGDAALIVSSSMPIRDLDLVMRPRSLPIYANRGVSGIDGFVSTAQGVAIARPGQPTYALTGDLSLLHDINGLMPGPSPRPDITYVVINNNGGGIFSLLPQGKSVEPTAFEQLFGTPHGIDIAAVATAYQCHHQVVATPAELRTALEWRPGVRIIEVRTDRTENAKLHVRLRAAAAAAVASLATGHDGHHD